MCKRCTSTLYSPVVERWAGNVSQAPTHVLARPWKTRAEISTKKDALRKLVNSVSPASSIPKLNQVLRSEYEIASVEGGSPPVISWSPAARSLETSNVRLEK